MLALTKHVPFFLPPAQSMPWLNLLPVSFIFSMHLFFPWMRTWSGISAKLCLLWAAFVMCKKNKVEDERPTSTSFNRSELKWALVEVFPHPDKIYMIIQLKICKYRKRCFQMGIALWVRWIDWIMRLFQISCESVVISDLSKKELILKMWSVQCFCHHPRQSPPIQQSLVLVEAGRQVETQTSRLAQLNKKVI